MFFYGTAGIFLGIVIMIAGIFSIRTSKKLNNKNTFKLGIIEIVISSILIISSIIGFITDYELIAIIIMTISMLTLVISIKKLEKKS